MGLISRVSSRTYRNLPKMGKNVQPKPHAKRTRKGKKRGKTMLKSEGRKKSKLDWQEYNNNWHGGVKLTESENKEIEKMQDELDKFSESEEEVLPLDMLDETEYKISDSKFLKNATLEAERKPRKFQGDEDDNSDEDEGLTIRDSKGNIVKSKIKREKKNA